MADKGWIKVHRQLQECWIWLDNDKFTKGQAWVDLLLFANHRDTKIPVDGKPLPISRGQFLTSIVKLSNRWKWDRKTTTKFLNILEKDGMIEQHKTSRWTTITIVNYEAYQETTDNSMDKCMDNTMDTNKNDKNVKNEKNNNIRHKYGEYNNVLLSDDDLEKLKTEFKDYEERIEKLSRYMASTGKSYKNHLATIRNWARKDIKPVSNKFNDFPQNKYSDDELEKRFVMN